MNNSKNKKKKKELAYDGEDLAELTAKYTSGEIDYEEFHKQLMEMD